MGHRTIKRVPLDFNWPLDKAWDGYLQPSYRPCPSDDCENGSKLAAEWLGDIVRLILMLGEYHEGSRHPGHPYLETVPFRPKRLPKANAEELTTGLAGRAPSVFGHDAIDGWRATAAIIKAAGLPEDWGTCPVCKGHAIHPSDVPAMEAWKPIEPPKGEGWQMWETTSEGSPQSPVFTTAQELAEWCSENATMFADMKATTSQWLQSIQGGSLDTDSLLIATLPS